jgi:hypothetical protein
MREQQDDFVKSRSLNLMAVSTINWNARVLWIEFDA